MYFNVLQSIYIYSFSVLLYKNFNNFLKSWIKSRESKDLLHYIGEGENLKIVM